MPSTAAKTLASLPANFEPNRGQADPRIDFVSHGRGYTLLLAPGEAFLQLFPRAGRSSGVRIQILGANRQIHGRALEPQPAKSAYFIGNDPGLWRTDIPQYGRVEYDQIYPGVDVAYYGQGQQIEYDFVLGPHAESRRIQLKIEGADKMQVDDTGDLVLTVGGSQIRQRRPVVYQETAAGRTQVEARYALLGGNRVGFQLARYDSRKGLVIDPALVFSTYFGGTGMDTASGVAVDASGTIYLSGQIATSPYAGTLLGPVFTGGGIADFLAKISPSGVLLSVTYIGGAYDTTADGTRVALDSNGNIYIAGETNSTSFPTVNAIQGTYPGGSDTVFVLELNNAANALIFSTYLGGNTGEYAKGVNVDSAGNIYVGGTTGSPNFPLYNAIQTNLPQGGAGIAFATKLTPGGGSFVYSTFFGGTNGGEYLNGSTIDSNGNFYIYGDTAATDLPVMNAFQPTFCGVTQGQAVTNNHGWVAKLSPSGTEVYATYVCGSIDPDAVRGAAADQYGDLFITGNTSSPTFPLLNPIEAQYGGGAGESFLTELSPSGGLLYSTYLGGSGDDVGKGVTLDSVGNIYVSGYTDSTDFPVVNPIQPQNAGANDAFLTKINASGSAILFSTYLGGSQDDFGLGPAVDALENVYLPGQTASPDFPTLNAFQPQYGGAYDGFLAVIATCSFTFSQPPQASAAGASGSITITTTPECGWNAASDSAWITLTSAVSGQGAGSVSYSVAANTGAARTGTLIIAGHTITIAQAASAASIVTHLSVAAPSSAAVGVPIRFTVAALNASNNIVTSFTDPVAFSSTDGSASLPGSMTLTNGAASFFATLATPGSQTITATDSLNSAINGTSASISVITCTNEGANWNPAATTIGSGTYCFQAGTSITVNSGFVVNGSANVTFVAGSSIVLSPGFDANGTTGATFTAYVQ